MFSSLLIYDISMSYVSCFRTSPFRQTPTRLIHMSDKTHTHVTDCKPRQRQSIPTTTQTKKFVCFFVCTDPDTHTQDGFTCVTWLTHMSQICKPHQRLSLPTHPLANWVKILTHTHTHTQAHTHTHTHMHTHAHKHTRTHTHMLDWFIRVAWLIHMSQIARHIRVGSHF